MSMMGFYVVETVRAEDTSPAVNNYLGLAVCMAYNARVMYARSLQAKKQKKKVIVRSKRYFGVYERLRSEVRLSRVRILSNIASIKKKKKVACYASLSFSITDDT